MLTRRQEQILSTPPSAGRQQQPGGHQQQQLGEASPVTPVASATTLPNGRPVPLKSALKQTRLGPGGGRAGDASDDGTPGAAGVKKHVRIHSSSNMVHIFQSSLNTDEWPGGAESPAGASSDREGDTPESSPRRRGGSRSSSGRQRSAGRPDLPRYSQFMAGVFGYMRSSRSSGGSANGASNGHSAASADRAGSSRGSGGRPRGGAVLGLLFTLSWMFASSALIFVNKLIMVDHGFRFPFALTSLGQLSSMLLGEWAGQGTVAPDCGRRGWLPCLAAHPDRTCIFVPTPTLLDPPAPFPAHCLVLLQPGWRPVWAWRHCGGHPPWPPSSPACCQCLPALRLPCSWETLPTWDSQVIACFCWPVCWSVCRSKCCTKTPAVQCCACPPALPGAHSPPLSYMSCFAALLCCSLLPAPPAVAFINIMKAATPMVTLAVGLAMGLERTCPTSLLATVLIAVGTAIATASEAASGGLGGWVPGLCWLRAVLGLGIEELMVGSK